MDNNDERVYRFKACFKCDKKVSREMELKGSTSLQEFARTIVNSFDFSLDHAFGFFNNIKSYHDSTEAYTSFKDDGMPLSRIEKSVRNTLIREVFEPQKKMHFHFDFGEDWEFLVECLGIVEAETGASYPKVTKVKGEAPKQYLPFSDDDNE